MLGCSRGGQPLCGVATVIGVAINDARAVFDALADPETLRLIQERR
jgi:hypothetical protein